MKYYRLKKKLDSYKVAIKANYSTSGPKKPDLKTNEHIANNNDNTYNNNDNNSGVKNQITHNNINNVNSNNFENNKIENDNNLDNNVDDENNENNKNTHKSEIKNDTLKDPLQMQMFDKEDQELYAFRSWLKQMNYYKNRNDDFSNLKTIKEINDYLDFREGAIGHEAANYFINQKELEEEIQKLKFDMEKIKKKELERIFKELIMNSYERRFSVDKEVLLKALVGEESALSELVNYRKEYYVS